MTPLQQIDFVFFYLRGKISAGGQWGYQNIYFHVNQIKESGINETLLKEIIVKLKEDGLLTEINNLGSQPTYHVTFEGLIFQGYVKADSEARKESQEVRNLRQATVDLQARMNKLTWWIVFGTIASVVVGILTLLKDCLQ